MKRWTSHEMLDLVLDEGTFTSWDSPIDLSGVEPGYRAVLEAAAQKAGTDESVVTGRGLVRGRPVAVVVNEFRFLGGSIGLAAAQRIVAAVRRATAEGLPLLARLAEIGIPAGKVRSLDEVYEWDQVASQGLLVDVEHPTLGALTLPGPPLRFFDAEGSEVTRRNHVAPPLLDQHADEIRAWVGGGGA